MTQRGNKKRQKGKQKRTAKIRKRAMTSRVGQTDSVASTNDTRVLQMSATNLPPYVHKTPFGMIVSSEDPSQMRIEELCGVPIYRPRTATEVLVRAEAEMYLRAKYESGTYTDSKKINEIIHYQFCFFDSQLKMIIPKIGSRHFIEFILHQYDLSCQIDSIWKKGELPAENANDWPGYLAQRRRALKYLAECTAMFGTNEAPTAAENDLLDLTDRAMICAEELVQMATLSDQTYMLFPDDSQLFINPPGKLDYFFLDVARPIGKEFLHRTRKDLGLRRKYIPFDYPLYDKDMRISILNEAFQTVFGLSHEGCIYILESLIHNATVPPSGFPIPFVPRDQMVKNASEVSGATPEAIERILNGFTASRTNMIAEGRQVWKPKQEYRAWRRGFFDFPHHTGIHLTWSKGMAKECMAVTIRDMAFQRVPPEWEAPSIRQGLNLLANRCGKEFERFCADHLKQRGFHIAASFRNYIGTGEAKQIIPGNVGELDCLAYSPTKRLLVLLECKLVQSGTEAVRFRDDLAQFTNPKDGFFVKFQKKVDWVRQNMKTIAMALESLPEAAGLDITPTETTIALVTFYPSIASYYTQFPCMSISELLDSLDTTGEWPYPQGLSSYRRA